MVLYTFTTLVGFQLYYCAHCGNDSAETGSGAAYRGNDDGGGRNNETQKVFKITFPNRFPMQKFERTKK